MRFFGFCTREMRFSVFWVVVLCCCWELVLTEANVENTTAVVEGGSGIQEKDDEVLDVCETNEDCANGGECQGSSSSSSSSPTGVYWGATCLCKPPYVGKFCNVKCPIVCENGGTCRFDQDDQETEDPFSCQCPPSHTGSLCQFTYTTCPDGTECLNGGKCVKEKPKPDDENENNNNNYKCNCPRGYEGFSCSVITPGAPIVSTSSSNDNSDRQRYLISIVSCTIVFSMGALYLLRLATRRRGYKLSFQRMTSTTAGAFEVPTNEEYNRHDTDII